jgi:flagellar protein FliJ
MKKFAFRLETLLQHRIKIEEKERDKFSRLRAEMLAELRRKEELCAQQADTLSALMLRKSCGSDSQEIAWHYRFLDRLAHEIKLSNQRTVELENSVEAQKRVMIEASRKKQMIENLKEKRRREHFIAMEREDQKNVDEIVVTRFARRP